LEGVYQIFPTSPGSFFADDSYTLPVDEFYILDKSPTSLSWKLWNLDDTHDHTIRATVIVLPLEVVIPLYGLQEVFTSIKRQQDLLYGILTGETQNEEGE
jgi:hypothetical protein